MRIYRSDLVDERGRMCSKGARLWWQRAGLDWSDFIEHGIDADALKKAAPNDARVDMVIERAARGQK